MPATARVPVIHKSQEPYGMFDDLRSYPWVHEVIGYADRNDLLTKFPALLVTIDALRRKSGADGSNGSMDAGV